MEISKICKYITSRIDSASLDVDNYISTENMMQNRGGVISASKVPKENAIEFKPGDILVSNLRPYFKKIWFADRYGGCSSDVLCIRALEGTDSVYLYYLLSQDTFFDHVMSGAKGCKMPRGDKNQIMRWEVDLPDIKEQKRIGQMLKSIDDKILLNNQINHNLEEQAQAIYKSWFVDFEPFKNGKFIESELGLIPEGWKIGKINDVINLLSGFPFKSSDFQENGDYQLITIKGVQDGYLDVTSADMLSSLPSKMPQYCILNIGDILISLTGNVGRICIVDRKNLLLNQRVAILSPKNIRDSFYVYTMFRSESMKNELIHIARGTAQLNLSPIETGEKLTVIPPDSILEAFAKVGKGTFNQYISLKMENIRLMEIRDSLLPKLMSGELKINDLTC